MSILPKLSRFDLSMIVISLVVGMGIFATPMEVSKNLTDPYLYFGVWLFGGFISLCGALTFAEIGARYPVTGGFYKAFSYSFHPAVAFMINWILVISNAASVAAVTLIGAEYVVPLVMPAHLHNTFWVKIMAIASVLLLYIVNMRGIKMSANTQNLLNLLKIAIVMVICSAIFRAGGPEQPVIYAGDYNTWPDVGISLVAVFFSYGGYQQTINFGGDSINAKVNIPKAIVTGMLVVIALYMLINVAYYRVLGIAEMQRTPALAAALAGYHFGALGYKIMSVLMFVSVLTFINVNIMSNPRIYYAMAEDGILPAIFKKVNPVTQIQEFGLTFFVIVVLCILLFVDSFRSVISYVMFFDTIGLSTAALSVFILRKRTRHLKLAWIYHAKLYPVIPVIFIITYWLVTLFIFMKHPAAAAVCMGIFAIGLLIYFISKRTKQHIT